MPSATVQAPEQVTTHQSIVLIRNLLRLNVSEILHHRGCFAESDFEQREVHGTRVHSLGNTTTGSECSPEAKTVISWLERGIFDAITRGYLERATLCISEDEAGTRMLESWTLSVSWEADSAGKEHPVLHTGGPHHMAVPLVSKERYSMAYVRDASKTMLRQLTLMLQTLPPLPSVHYISMRLLYRDDKTPPSYEPMGFERATNPGICFVTEPLQLSVAQPVSTEHNALRVMVHSVLLDRDEAAGATGVMLEQDEISQQPRYRLDLSGASPEPSDALVAASPVPDEQQMATLIAASRAHIEAADDGSPFGSAQLAPLLSCSKATAEAVLEILEGQRLLTAYKPGSGARLVQKTPARRSSQLTDTEGSSTGSQSEGEESHSPIAARTAASTMAPTPPTRTIRTVSVPTTPSANANGRKRSQPGASNENTKATTEPAPNAKSARKESATTATVQSHTPGRNYSAASSQMGASRVKAPVATPMRPQRRPQVSKS